MSKKKKKKGEKYLPNQKQNSSQTNLEQKLIPGPTIQPTNLGRPSDYSEKVVPFLHKIPSWVLMGYTNKNIADKLNISESTFYKYLEEFSEFSESVNKNKSLANEVVIKSLFEKCQNRLVEESYEEEEMIFIKDKITGLPMIAVDKNGNQLFKKKKRSISKIIPADTKAQQFWLMNRDPEHWRTKTDAGDTTINNSQTNNTDNSTKNIQIINSLTKDELIEKMKKFYEIRSNNDSII